MNKKEVSNHFHSGRDQQNQVGDGEFSQTINNNGDSAQADPLEAINDVFKAMGVLVSPASAAMDESIAPDSPVHQVLEEVQDDLDFEPLNFENDHEELAGEFMTYSTRSAVPEEQQQDFLDRLRTNLEHAATAAKPGFFKCCSIASKVCEAYSAPGIVGLIGIGLSEFVEKFGGEDA